MQQAIVDTGVNLVAAPRTYDSSANTGSTVGRVLRVLPHLVGRELRIRYRRTRFGIAWGVLQPLLRFAAMGFVFGAIAKLDIDRYLEFLLVGIVAWTWWSSGVTGATTCVVDRRELVQRPGLPRVALPLAVTLTALVDLSFALPIVFGVLVATDGVGLPALLLPVLLIAEGLWVAGVGVIASASHVYFRDTKPIVETAMMIGVYATPVVWDIALAPAWARPLLGLNPLAAIISSIREVLINGTLPSWWDVTWPLVAGAAVLAGAVVVFQRTSPDFLDEL